MIDIDKLIRRSNELTPLPETIQRLIPMLADENVDVDDVEDAFSYDGALSGKLLRQANSVQVGGGGKIGTISAAVVRLGFDNVMAMAVAACTQDELTKPLPQYGLKAGDLRKHAQAARLAVDAMRKFAGVDAPPEAATAALLHDIGKVVMAECLDSAMLDFLQQASGGQAITMDAEREVLTVHHGELGGLIAQHWNLPDIIVRGIMYHHDPEHCTETDNRICHLLCAADWIAHASYHWGNQLTFDTPAPSSISVLGVKQGVMDKLMRYVVEGTRNLQG